MEPASVLQALRTNSANGRQFLVAPGYVFDRSALNESTSLTFKPWPAGGTQFGLHLDTDHLDEFFASDWSRWGVGIWSVNAKGGAPLDMS